MANKQNKHKPTSRLAKAKRQSEILRAKRAVSYALGQRSLSVSGPEEESVVEVVSAAIPGPANLSAGLDGMEEASSVSTPFAEAIRNMVVGLFESGTNTKIGHRLHREGNEKETNKPLSVASSSYDPLADLARRHISQADSGPIANQGRIDQLCGRVLENLAKVRIQNLLVDQGPGQLTKLKLDGTTSFDLSKGPMYD